MDNLLKDKKLKDIKAIEFGDEPNEIVSSLENLVMLFEIDDDKEVIALCKEKLQEGIELLKQIDHPRRKEFDIS